MRKHVSTTRPTYLAAVLQDASKSHVFVFVIMHYSVRCGHRGIKAYAHSCTFMFMFVTFHFSLQIMGTAYSHTYLLSTLGEKAARSGHMDEQIRKMASSK